MILKDDYKEILLAVDELLESDQNPILIGIDGKCTAGKSTLGELLKKHYDCNLFHMDDFFLRNEQRTPQRFAEIGGNVDYERFQEEVLNPVLNKEKVFYRPFRCSTRTITDGITIPFQRLNVVEGSYSLHPYFKDPYQLKIFLDIDDKKQVEAIRERNGEEQLKRFIAEWIPKENAYIETFHIKDGCIRYAR